MNVGTPEQLGYWESQELRLMGLSCGDGCLVAKRAEIFNAEYVTLGSNIRIDGDVFISACEEGVQVGNGVHISRGVYIFGMYAAVVIGPYTAISPGARLFTGTDDFTAVVGCTPATPACHREIIHGSLQLDSLVAIGANSVVMPGVRCGVGSAVAAGSFVSAMSGLQAGVVYGGVPARRLKYRGDGVDVPQQFKDLLIKLEGGDQ